MYKLYWKKTKRGKGIKMSNKLRVMISQPMNGKTEEQIREERKTIIEKFNNIHIDVIDTIFTEEPPESCNKAVYYLGKSIEAMKDIDALYMCDGWREARGCRIEHQVAREYRIKILYKDFFVNKPELGNRTLYYEEDKQ